MLQGEHSAILSTFIKLPFAIKAYVLSIFELPLKTGFTVCTHHALLNAEDPSQENGHIQRGDRGLDPPPLENLKLLYVYLDILVLTPLDKQLNPLGPIASQGKSVRLSVKYVETKRSFRTPDRLFWIRI